MAEQKQQSVIIPIDAQTQDTINGHLENGYVISIAENLGNDTLLIIFNKNLPPPPEPE